MHSERLNLPATSTISPGTSSVAGSIEKQPAEDTSKWMAIRK